MKTQSITLNLFVENVKDSAVFYSDMLNLELVMQVPEKGDPSWVYLKRGNSGIMIQDRKGIPGDISGHLEGSGGSPLLIYVMADSIAAAYEKARLRKCIVREMESTFYGHREFSMLDPDGLLITIAEEVETGP